MPLAAADFLSLKQNKKSLSAWCGVREMWVQTWPLVPHPLRPSPRGQAAAAAAPLLSGSEERQAGWSCPRGGAGGACLGPGHRYVFCVCHPVVTRYVLVLSPFPQVSSHNRTGSISSTSQPSPTAGFSETPGPLHEVTPGASAEQVASPAVSLAVGAAWYGEGTVLLLSY